MKKETKKDKWDIDNFLIVDAPKKNKRRNW
uniref:Uncharacterized protein n=1 Tax=Mycoplasma feriruminatoris TaxID=1179777 RepID=A0A654IJJ0_9MOLU|nr:hypothetical protein MF5292_00436 [Mycoplasma feriruminatoris]VZR75412.1 hypothetical protein MF5294_00440 [Mycoplasma feriruminatoris]VZR97669.1 hypothetical protein MF5293_00438 [Mycoplasma feriruminatoris]VZS00165.1 hypothetical protein MF5582_00459 [Mycoplasma feriruminatoris]